jgi:hypothetical protein
MAGGNMPTVQEEQQTAGNSLSNLDYVQNLRQEAFS